MKPAMGSKAVKDQERSSLFLSPDISSAHLQVSVREHLWVQDL